MFNNDHVSVKFSLHPHMKTPELLYEVYLLISIQITAITTPRISTGLMISSEMEQVARIISHRLLYETRRSPLANRNDPYFVTVVKMFLNLPVSVINKCSLPNSSKNAAQHFNLIQCCGIRPETSCLSETKRVNLLPHRDHHIKPWH